MPQYSTAISRRYLQYTIIYYNKVRLPATGNVESRDLMSYKDLRLYDVNPSSVLQYYNTVQLPVVVISAVYYYSILQNSTVASRSYL